MQQETYNLIQDLQDCTYLPGSPDKRFVHQMSCMLPGQDPTEPQMLYLGQLKYRFRGQLKAVRDKRAREVQLEREAKTRLASMVPPP